MQFRGGDPLRIATMCFWFAAAGVAAQATPIILMGSDYMHTTAGTQFAGVPFQGVPFGPGNTDTIVRRLSDATLSGVGSNATIPIELAALNLVSVMPVDFGLGLGLYYITLQAARGGPASLGMMQINFNTADDNLPGTPQGTFDSFFDVFFDIRLGALDGPIAFSNNLQLSSQGASWDANPDPGTVLVPGPAGDGAANSHTNKGLDELDFFPGPISEAHPSGMAIHNVVTATPEPGSMVLLGAGLGALWAVRRRRSILG